MTILVGYPMNRRAKAVLSLAGMLARSSGEDLVVCTMLPVPWLPGVTREDAGFRNYVGELAESALANAKDDMPEDVSVTFTTGYARSTASGLLQAADEHNARMIVVGSAMGMIEHVTVSSVADRLLHSSHIPIAVATRGFRAMGARVERVTLAFTGGPQATMLVGAAAELAEQLDADLRLASFAVQMSPPETVRFSAEGDAILKEWRQSIGMAAEAAVAAHPAAVRRSSAPVIGQGDDWEEALDSIDWRPGDLLIMGSSETGPMARVFLGSRATKILRNTPVPIIAVPRTAASELDHGDRVDG